MTDADGFDRGAVGADIHELTRRRMERHSPVLEEAWRYWASLRSGRGVPARDALDPRAMGLTLGHSMILDHVRPGTVRVRLGGRVMNEMMGMEVRGLPLRAFFEVAERDRVSALTEQVFTAPATLEMDLSTTAPGGPVRARMLILPLRDATGRVTKALATVALERHAFAPPHRFALMRHALSPLRPHPALAGTRALLDRRTPEEMALAEAQTPYEAGPKPYLRVVK